VVPRQRDPRILPGAAARQDVAPRREDEPIHGNTGEIDVSFEVPRASCNVCDHLGVLAAGKVLAVASNEEDFGRVGRERAVEIGVTRRGVLYEGAIGLVRGQLAIASKHAAAILHVCHERPSPFQERVGWVHGRSWRRHL